MYRSRVKRPLGAAIVSSLAAVTFFAWPMASQSTAVAEPGTDTAPAVSLTNTVAHLEKFQAIADANNGQRATGTPGHAQSLEYIQAKLDAAGFETHIHEFESYNGQVVQGRNLIADLPGGDTSNVVMAGAHLDGVTAGPGINDNGSGSAGLLELALSFQATGQVPQQHVRFAWWDGEEFGLLGSKAYVADLSATEKASIDGYLNFDMIGSPNYGVFVYDDNAAGDELRDKFTAYFDHVGVPWEFVNPNGRSDHAGFIGAGIPTAGLFSGANGLPANKTAAQVQKWGGTVGSWDPCYHRACDDIDNISQESIAINLGAMADITWSVAGFGPSVTDEPGPEPTTEPTVEPTTEPTVEPTTEPTVEPTAEPTVEPTAEPTVEPTVQPTPPKPTKTRKPPKPHPHDKFRNGDFEDGRVAWKGSKHLITKSGEFSAKSGEWKVVMAPRATSTQVLRQKFTVPTAFASTMTLHTKVVAANASERARFAIQVIAKGKRTNLLQLNGAEARAGWQNHKFDLTKFAGKKVTLRLVAKHNVKAPATFLVDDIALR